MIEKSHIGREFPAHSVAVEAGRLRFFAKATGQTDPVYLDEAAARDAGYRGLPVPPTFLFSLEVEQPDPFAWFNSIGLDLARVLHGEQLFTYHAPACAGDVLTFSSRISDVYDKKGGTLDFVVKETRVTNQDGVLIADLRATIVQRNA